MWAALLGRAAAGTAARGAATGTAARAGAFKSGNGSMSRQQFVQELNQNMAQSSRQQGGPQQGDGYGAWIKNG